MINLDGLEEFLIKESKINKDFIKDFFGIQKNKAHEKYKPFTIDLEDIAFWLDAGKGHIKNTLVKNYLYNIDYIILNHEYDGKNDENLLLPLKRTQKKEEDNRGGHNKELILLTSDCFKMLCMRSKTKKANKVRQYYIDLEKLIDQYKDLIINQQTKKIEILENDLRKEVLPKEGYCYIYLEKDELNEEYYRLGQSGNIQKRFHNHNSSSAHKKIVAFKIKTDNIIHFEACLRGVMFDYRYKNDKDYYKLPKDKIKDAIKKCKNIVKEFKNDIIIKEPTNPNEIHSGGSINIKKINNQIAKMFSYSCECVMWNMYDKPNKAYYNGKNITDKKLKETILPKTYLDKLLIVAMHRFEENVEVINLGNEKYSYLRLFNLLYKYYNKEKLDINVINKIPIDIDDYKKDAIKKYNSGKDVFRIDIIGSLCRFENIKLIDYNIYSPFRDVYVLTGLQISIGELVIYYLID